MHSCDKVIESSLIPLRLQQNPFENVSQSCTARIEDVQADISQTFIERSWNALLDVIGDDPDILYVWYLTIYTYGLYWILGGLFALMDLTNRPKFLRKYKTQPGTHEPLRWDHFKKLIKTVAFNQVVVAIPTAYISYHCSKLFVTMPNVRVVPSLGLVLRDMAVCIFVWETGFYYLHRMFHSRHFYQSFHKQHHEWRAPVALSAMYAHPLETLLNSLPPILLGPGIMRSHLFTTVVWMTFVTWDSLGDHSGYHLPFLGSSEAHDYHHLNFNQCYGNFGLYDRLHGTDNEFRKKKHYQRHRRNFGFKSARELVPGK
ncbi:fatty acid hydroxylase domain-containing protein 2-like [Anopheles bellator]|uniref:fatty acid hydroxylase domain-containing protein 2-like n=1 Tax=Anopheles bellator TaxID=139047 RepID=UPI0026497A6D|nr:fatty acid hydroxylase domain-containing protein 2-like [Anopheles bellator]